MAAEPKKKPLKRMEIGSNFKMIMGLETIMQRMSNISKSK